MVFSITNWESCFFTAPRFGKGQISINYLHSKKGEGGWGGVRHAKQNNAKTDDEANSSRKDWLVAEVLSRKQAFLSLTEEREEPLWKYDRKGRPGSYFLNKPGMRYLQMRQGKGGCGSWILAETDEFERTL